MRADDSLDDGPLVERARRGSRDAAGELVERHWRSSWRVARGITGDPATAEEVAQESLISALGALDRFDPARGTFRAWLHRITVNRALNATRRERRHTGLDAADEIAAEAADDVDGRFLEAIATLKPSHRAVLVLRYGLDYAPPEIAAALELPLGTVNSRLARALDALRQTMESPHAP
jgi:RNA polymerase sigma factor (sigma-70 family)